MGAIQRSVKGDRVNEPLRDSRQKLFSCAVAALSNFFWESLRVSRIPLCEYVGPLLIVRERYKCVRTLNPGLSSHKVIWGVSSFPAMVPQRS